MPELQPQNPADAWKTELSQALRTADDLAEAGLITPESVPAYRQLLARYRVAIPRYYARLIDRANPACPIRRQAVPSLEELHSQEGWSADPLADLKHQPVARVTHRYRNRALFHLTMNCSMYCRYCFRKSLLNELSADLFRGQAEEGLRYFAEHTELEEVIFSGGDPFLVGDGTVRWLVEKLSELKHLRRIRFHSRVPVTFPARVTESLAAAIASTRLPVVVVTHFNHPRELTGEAAAACATLRARGITLLNQSVLLRGVNDDVHTLVELNRGVFELGVLPYYLHHPDRAQGTSHFDVPMAEGVALHDSLRARLPGYLVPRYVVDDPAHPFKQDVRCTHSFPG